MPDSNAISVCALLSAGWAGAPAQVLGGWQCWGESCWRPSGQAQFLALAGKAFFFLFFFFFFMSDSYGSGGLVMYSSKSQIRWKLFCYLPHQPPIAVNITWLSAAYVAFCNVTAIFKRCVKGVAFNAVTRCFIRSLFSTNPAATFTTPVEEPWSGEDGSWLLLTVWTGRSFIPKNKHRQTFNRWSAPTSRQNIRVKE